MTHRCPTCNRPSEYATPGYCQACGITADLAAVAHEIATEPDDADLMAAWQDAIEPGLFDAPEPGEDREASCPVCRGDLVVLAGIDDDGNAYHRPCPCTGEETWAAFGADAPPPYAITGTIAPSDWPMPDWLARGLVGLPPVRSFSDLDVMVRGEAA